MTVAVAALAVLLAACSSSPTTSSLAGSVAGLPTGANGNVSVTGPGGYSTVVTTPTTLNNLTPGTYTVTADTAHVAGAIADTVYTGAGGGSETVTAGATATATATYALRPGTGKL